MSTSRIADMATELLGHCKDALTNQGLELPDRIYVSHSEPAWDCELLTVHLVTLKPMLMARGDPTVTGRQAMVGLAQFGISLVRCVTTATAQGDSPPTSDDLGADALARLTDAWALWSWITRLWGLNKLWGETTASTPNMSPTTFDSCVPVGPSGGFAGVKMLLTVQIPAFREAENA